MIEIEAAASADGELVEAVRLLLPQVASAPPPSPEDIGRIVADPAITLLVARDGGQVVGMLTLAVFGVLSGNRAWIEDVVVDEAARGAGIASALVTAALEHAVRQGARTVDLTSRPEREAANRLYVRLGFEKRATNVYRRALDGPD
jgi:ribosomal protein S18 acetylase RimI-like enzyme